MYVCICNALNDRRIRAAVREYRPNRVSDVYRCLGVAPAGGKCARQLRDILVEEGILVPRHDCCTRHERLGNGAAPRADDSTTRKEG